LALFVTEGKRIEYSERKYGGSVRVMDLLEEKLSPNKQQKVTRPTPLPRKTVCGVWDKMQS
jgi:hypothetical protein